MVTAAIQTSDVMSVRWLGYLILSVLANLLIVSAVDLSRTPNTITVPPQFRISFKALAKPAAASVAATVPQKVTMPVPKPEVVLKPAPSPQPVMVAVAAVPPPLPVAVEIVKKASAKKIIAKPSLSIERPVEKLRPEVKKVTFAVPKPKMRRPVEEETVKSVVVMEAPPVPKPVQELEFKTADIKKTDIKKADIAEKEAVARRSAFQDAGQQDSTVIHEAEYRRKTPPNYPRRALDLGQQGAVSLHVLVNAKGLPKELKVASSSGYRLLDKAAIAAVKKWEFIPAHSAQGSAGSWVRVPVNFVIR